MPALLAPAIGDCRLLAMSEEAAALGPAVAVDTAVLWSSAQCLICHSYILILAKPWDASGQLYPPMCNCLFTKARLQTQRSTRRTHNYVPLHPLNVSNCAQKTVQKQPSQSAHAPAQIAFFICCSWTQSISFWKFIQTSTWSVLDDSMDIERKQSKLKNIESLLSTKKLSSL